MGGPPDAAGVPPHLARIHELSRLASESGDAQALGELHALLRRPEFTLEQRHFFYWQRIVRHADIRGVPALEPAALYRSLLGSYRQALGIRAPWIPPAERDADSIVVITNQLLGLAHAPTADCLDYCYILQTKLRKKVFLINTADMPWTPQLPYFNPVTFNYVADYSTLGRLSFKGQALEFYQCRKPMPNLDELSAIVGTVLTRKPSFVFSLGHSNVAADLCAEFLTVTTMPFGTNLPQARSTLFVLPRRRRPDDTEFMRQWGIGEDQIIEAEYTFRLPERTASLTRADLGLPPDAYVIAVVGNRLDEEIGDAVATELAALLAAVPRAFLAFMGTFPSYARLAERDEVFARRSVFLGHQKDVPAAYECFDAYWNPPRWGGGSSAAFALAMGLPVLTRATGDVANIAGERFVFESADAIVRFVATSAGDDGHHREWAATARARFEEISDREGMLRHIVEESAQKAELRRSQL